MKPVVKKTTRKTATPSQARANKGVRDGANKSKEIADQFMNQYFAAGTKGDHPEVVKSAGYGKAKKTKGASTPRAKAADAAFGSYKNLAKRGK